MNIRNLFVLLMLLFALAGCEKDDVSPTGGDASESAFRNSSSSDFSGSGSTPSPTGGSSGNGQTPDQSGLITAGEWRDLDHWDFWNTLKTNDTLGKLINDWDIRTTGRISVVVTGRGGLPLRDASVSLRSRGELVGAVRTDNLGRAEFFINPTAGELKLSVDGREVSERVTYFEQGPVAVSLPAAFNKSERVELAFIVDATGSMGDELEFLKDDLNAIIGNIERQTSARDIVTGTVFYRDEGDDYVTRYSPLTDQLSVTRTFISKQSAGGGGDYPEAVHSALRTALTNLNWSESARTRIAFLLLDAPPHGEDERVMNEYRSAVVEAARRGIRIVPIVASGIDKETEFLMRLTAIVTSGTYVFITDDSGIGGDHIEATVGDYEVEYLKDLMVRLVAEWAG